MSDYIVVGGKESPVVGGLTGRPIRVRRWNDGLLPRVTEFRPGDGFNKVRRGRVDLIVSHWTGGEGEPDRVGETLRKRKLGIEWSVARVGEVWQHCDPVFVDTADVGLLNYRSGGIEVVCYGFAGGFTIDPVRAIRVPLVPRLGKDRETYVAMTHGRRVVTAKPYPAQMDAWLGLCTTISEALDVPKQVPPIEFDDQVFPLALGSDPLTRFKGHIAHYHATTKKRDIGPWPIQQLRAHFAGATP